MASSRTITLAKYGLTAALGAAASLTITTFTATTANLTTANITTANVTTLSGSLLQVQNGTATVEATTLSGATIKAYPIGAGYVSGNSGALLCVKAAAGTIGRCSGISTTTGLCRCL